MPGLGCGLFAGRFQETIHEAFRQVLRRLLIEFGAELPELAAVNYDSFRQCTNSREEIHGISFFVRPLEQGNHGKSQLCRPYTYARDFAHCQLFSLVAWDHVSWPGNDFFAGARATDDGVKAAATNSMAVITGIEGHYDPVLHQYQPPVGYRTWGQLVRARGLRLWDRRAVWQGETDL